MPQLLLLFNIEPMSDIIFLTYRPLTSPLTPTAAPALATVALRTSPPSQLWASEHILTISSNFQLPVQARRVQVLNALPLTGSNTVVVPTTLLFIAVSGNV